MIWEKKVISQNVLKCNIVLTNTFGSSFCLNENFSLILMQIKNEWMVFQLSCAAKKMMNTVSRHFKNAQKEMPCLGRNREIVILFDQLKSHSPQLTFMAHAKK